MTAWLIEGGVVALVTPAYLGLATRSAAHFVAASKDLGVELGDWDRATLQDR
jgi:hypothetical protein